MTTQKLKKTSRTGFVNIISMVGGKLLYHRYVARAPRTIVFFRLWFLDAIKVRSSQRRGREQLEALGAVVLRTGIDVGDKNVFGDGFLITITIQILATRN